MNPNAIVILTCKGIADPKQESALNQLRESLSKPDSKLLLHLHGGLIDQAAGEAIAQRISGHGPNSWNLGPDWTQLYVVWRTGALEVLRNDWQRLVHDDRIYQTILRKLIRFAGQRLGVVVVDGSRAAIGDTFGLDENEIQLRITGEKDRRDPFGEIEVHFAPELAPGSRAGIMGARSDAALAMDFEKELNADSRFHDAVAEVDGVINQGLPGRTVLVGAPGARGTAALERLSPEVRAEIEASATARPGGARGIVSVTSFILKHAGMIAYRVFKRFRTQRDHGFHATIVEELCRELYGDLVGAKIWGLMVQHAADHFTPGGFGTQLLDLLKEFPPARLAVTAHSAGSIWASRMLLALAERQHPLDMRLFLLAPAVRRDLFAKAIDASSDRISSAHMFTMNDEYERRDPVLGDKLGYIYPSSLLYCVSGMFEDHDVDAYPDAPLLGMMRHAGSSWLEPDEAADSARIARFFAEPNNGITNSPSPGVTMAKCHGCFDDEEFTLKTVARLMQA